MTNWTPEIEGSAGPRYIAIADALAVEVAEGRFKPGERLPTHRNLAWKLGVTVGTVSRAYAEAERRGLVSGEVGRGTYVRGLDPRHVHINYAPSESPSTAIDLSSAILPPGDEARHIGPALAALAKDPRAAQLLCYQPHAGRPEHRAAGAEWVARRGLDVSPDQVVLTNGGNHGILVAFAAATRPGDRVLTENLSYALVQPIARMLGLRLEGVATDREGLIPEALETACRTSDVTALYTIPTVQNPTTAVMSEARRRAIAEVAEGHGMSILEDDIFALLAESPPPPIASFAPERTYYINSLSKTLAPGLRIGYVGAPADALERVANAVRATCMSASPFPAEIASRWIRDGTADRILASHRREVAARRERVLDILGDREVDCPVGSLHFWLHLPEPWRASDFVAEAKLRGVLIASAEIFAIGRREVPHAVRAGLGTLPSREPLERALRILAKLLDESPPQAFGTIV